MITEKKIRNIYEGFYELAKEYNELEYTRDTYLFLNRICVNRISPIEGDSQEKGDLWKMTREIDQEYTSKFEELIKKQGDEKQ